MQVSTRYLFKDYSITVLAFRNERNYTSTEIFPTITPEIIKELNIEKGISSSLNVYLLEERGKKALFDTGYNETNNGKLLDRLKEIKISPDEIEYIFITHFHGDHIGGLLDKDDNIIYKNAKVYVSE